MTYIRKKKPPLCPADYTVIEDTGCWQWAHYTQPNGYGKCSRLKKTWMAHRLMWVERVGPIPDGWEIDHLCSNRACVNPDHLEPVTKLENLRRSWPAHSLSCVRGHRYTPETVRIGARGERQCRPCDAWLTKQRRNARAAGIPLPKRRPRGDMTDLVA